jgi:acyl-coenzyme A synthetase/AMP-(fatty) acid ligase
VAEARGEELEAINQHTVTDHHCGPTAIRMFMELKGRNILRRRNPC